MAVDWELIVVVKEVDLIEVEVLVRVDVPVEVEVDVEVEVVVPVPQLYTPVNVCEPLAVKVLLGSVLPVSFQWLKVQFA